MSAWSKPKANTVVVGEALDVVGETLRRQGIHPELRVISRLPEVPGDPDQIQQVCLNLLMNAIHAMPAGGHLRVTLSLVNRRKGGLDQAAPADYVMVQVMDTGAGISEADRNNIFEPFFTTKDEGQGTGLGLAVSNGIVKDHDGWIDVESPPAGQAQGTAFAVFLPVGADGLAAVQVMGKIEGVERDAGK